MEMIFSRDGAVIHAALFGPAPNAMERATEALRRGWVSRRKVQAMVTACPMLRQHGNPLAINDRAIRRHIAEIRRLRAEG